MSLSQKIEEIRRKPEQERMRFVWGSVAVSMFFVIIVWFFSLTDMLGDAFSEETLGEQPSPIEGVDLQNLQELIPEIPAESNRQQPSSEASEPLGETTDNTDEGLNTLFGEDEVQDTQGEILDLDEVSPDEGVVSGELTDDESDVQEGSPPVESSEDILIK